MCAGVCACVCACVYMRVCVCARVCGVLEVPNVFGVEPALLAADLLVIQRPCHRLGREVGRSGGGRGAKNEFQSRSGFGVYVCTIFKGFEDTFTPWVGEWGGGR